MTAQVAQEASLVLAAGTSNTRVAQQAILVLAAPVTPSQVGQVSVLVLSRVKHRRVLTHFDTGS